MLIIFTLDIVSYLVYCCRTIRNRLKGITNAIGVSFIWYNHLILRYSLKNIYMGKSKD
jgi:hypothetical protein